MNVAEEMWIAYEIFDLMSYVDSNEMEIALADVIIISRQLF
jgi:hypothetical protein